MSSCTWSPAFEAHRWKPIEIAGIVIGLLIYWPIGVALFGLKMWKLKKAGVWDFPQRPFGGFNGFASTGHNATGNSAFEDYKRETLERLEAERRRLAEEEREFARFMDELKRTQDRETFDRFMQSRRGPTAA